MHPLTLLDLITKPSQGSAAHVAVRRVAAQAAALEASLRVDGKALCQTIEVLGEDGLVQHFGEDAAKVAQLASDISAAAVRFCGVPLLDAPIDSIEAPALKPAKKATKKAARKAAQK